MLRSTLITVLKWNGFDVDETDGFDTVRWKSNFIIEDYNVNYEDGYIILSLDELSNFNTILDIVKSQTDLDTPMQIILQAWDSVVGIKWSNITERTKPWLQQEVFNKYHSETNMMRYIHELVSKDFSLVNGMIPLGSCTMKLNAAAELMPVSWNHFSNIHPFAPQNQTLGCLLYTSDAADE